MDDKKTIERNVKTILGMIDSTDFKCYCIHWGLIIIRAKGKAYLLSTRDEGKNFISEYNLIPLLIENINNGNNQIELFNAVEKNYTNYDSNNYQKALYDAKNIILRNKSTANEKDSINNIYRVINTIDTKKESKIKRYNDYYLLELLVKYKLHKCNKVFHLLDENNIELGYSDVISQKQKLSLSAECGIDINIDVTFRKCI